MIIALIFLGVCNFTVGTLFLADAIKKEDDYHLLNSGMAALNYGIAIIIMGIVFQNLDLI